MNEENKLGYYAIIPSTVLFNKDLKANEKLLYAVITVLANKEGYCYASNNYLADLFNSKPHTISNWISHLNKLNFVYVELVRNNKNDIMRTREGESMNNIDLYKIEEYLMSKFARIRLENLGYRVYFTGAKFVYENANRMVQSNELIIAIKEE